MRKPLVAAFFALAIAGAGAAPAVAAPSGAPADTAGAQRARAASPTLQAVSFAGTVSLSNCSGSVIRFPASVDTDPALVLTNGHCLETGFPSPGQVITGQSSSRSFGLLNSAGTRVGTLRANQVVYSTMTDTDVTIYRTTTTYASIRSTYGINALTVQDTHPVAGTAITVASGYWKRLYNCNIDGFVYRLKEGDWTWKDSVRYTSACNTIGGTSGSPVIDQSTGKVVAVNNTGNEDGERCTVNNPCEVDQNGTVTVRQGINYAEETYQIPACFTTGNRLNLSASGCTLPKP
ncbi:serine protease [Streptomyces longwoodensis]|jgi:V8-like Glu-specific endopeptidase|uniref:Trypsin-like peptidase domain-containing protein n=1 Tax=Streptomyces lasalocidi TaxID=324833 RepID=A0A4U5WKC4_STRLS|nr:MULTISPECIES: serine protease [Streptomyces]MCX4995629.1 serine protease [Streptomyces longwoodensis]TKT02497.1 trypsin-like peptidase domain-containing protein [Streptomyces lasalocidi]WRY90377.1 serine protease [Streptomyces longwoodensis]WTI45318.1 serine protease [Streptomyces longwoodensis]WUC58124.1 serine protease [Streptomyces longwoodensis]